MHQVHLEEAIKQRDLTVKQQVDTILTRRDERLAQTAKIIESTLFPVEDAQKAMKAQINELREAFERAKSAKDEEISRLNQRLLDADRLVKMLSSKSESLVCCHCFPASYSV